MWTTIFGVIVCLRRNVSLCAHVRALARAFSHKTAKHLCAELWEMWSGKEPWAIWHGVCCTRAHVQWTLRAVHCILWLCRRYFILMGWELCAQYKHSHDSISIDKTILCTMYYIWQFLPTATSKAYCFSIHLSLKLKTNRKSHFRFLLVRVINGIKIERQFQRFHSDTWRA